jgi:3-keto-disaccharide hydrolase
MSRRPRIALAALFAAALAGTPALELAAQQPPPPGTPPPAGQPPQGRGEGRGQGRGGGGGRGPAPLNLEDRAGFDSIFDGQSLKGWDGDPAFWKVENGVMLGQSTEANPVTANTFLIWRGGEPGDFELKLQFRMNSTNSGVQVRSEQVPPGSPAGREGSTIGKWVLKGYQADIDFDNRYTGMIYEERGTRGFLAPRGVASYIGPDSVKKTIGNLERNADELKAIIKAGDWNDVHVIARGTMLVNIVNGHVMSMLVDDDPKNRALKGLLGFQIHTGPPMKIEFRHVYLKKL